MDISAIVEFFRNAPVLASILCLTYVVLWGLFIYMMIRMYRK